MDEEIASFTAITSQSPEVAARYLELAEYNLEAAIQLFFDNPNLDLGVQPNAQQPNSSNARTTSNTVAEREVITIDSDEEGDLINLGNGPATQGNSRRSQPDFNDDAEMARRMQEEMYAEAEGGGVRAPMARTTETLVGPGATWQPGDDDLDAAVAEQIRARERTQRLNRRKLSRSNYSLNVRTNSI
jgi:UBX domain-containing protein 7